MTRTNSASRSVLSVENMTRIGVLTAMSAVLFFTLEIPVIAFYKLDFSTLPALLGGLAMGPVPALIILVLKDVIHIVIKGLGSTMGIGDLADFIMSAALVLPPALMYRHNRTRKTAAIGMLVGIAAMMVAGVLVNWLLLIPAYMAAYHMDLNKIIGMATETLPFVDTEWKLLLFVTAPFNLLKGGLISLITFLVYKPLSGILNSKSAK